MKTSKVNFITRFTNYFSQTGRQANLQIAEMQSDNPKATIYQKRLKEGAIGLLQSSQSRDNEISDTFILIHRNGIGVKDSRQDIFTDNKHNPINKLTTISKELFDKSALKIKSVKKSIFYALPQNTVEEVATKTHNLDGSTQLIVKSSGNRKSAFPITRLAGSLHPSMAEKFELSNGDKIFIEKYPQY